MPQNCQSCLPPFSQSVFFTPRILNKSIWLFDLRTTINHIKQPCKCHIVFHFMCWIELDKAISISPRQMWFIPLVDGHQSLLLWQNWRKKNHDYDSSLLLMKHVFGISSSLCHDFNMDKQWSLKGYVTFVKSIEETFVKCLLVDI